MTMGIKTKWGRQVEDMITSHGLTLESMRLTRGGHIQACVIYQGEREVLIAAGKPGDWRGKENFFALVRRTHRQLQSRAKVKEDASAPTSLPCPVSSVTGTCGQGGQGGHRRSRTEHKTHRSRQLTAKV
jgi:hypothetical protein